MNLDYLERMLGRFGSVAAVAGDDRVALWFESTDRASAADAVNSLARRMRVHPSGFDVRHTDRLPLLPSGKVDYRTLGQAT